jgi:hypothetical protein
LTTTILKTESSNPKTTVVPIDQLRPHEKGSPLYLQLLTQEILRDGKLKYPLIADQNTHIILDGMHRWLALKSLGYQLAPIIEINVYQNPRVRVGTRRIHQYINNKENMTIEHVIHAGLTGQLMQPRSTRHFFPFNKHHLINYPLNMLNKGPPRDVSQYLAKMTSKESSFAIAQWLDEISEELEFLDKRKVQVEKERDEFLNRIKTMKQTY